jgi:anti-sigma-K factor RskA
MSNRPHHSDQGCEEHSQLLPELALGCLDGRERATALGHIRRCARCRRELSGYQALAADLLDLVPAAPPPAGFEVRALAAMKAQAGAQPRRRPGLAGAAWRRGRLLAAAAAVIVVIAAALFGGYQLGRPGTPRAPLGSATLTAAGRQVGAVYFYSGAHPWVWVTVWAVPGPAAKTQNVTCMLWPGAGRPPMTIGTFALVSGHGSWGVPLPRPIGTATLTLGRAGRTLATATIRA